MRNVASVLLEGQTQHLLWVQARNCEGLTKILNAFGPAALLSGATGEAFYASHVLLKQPKQRYPALVALVNFMKKAFNEKVGLACEHGHICNRQPLN